MNNQVCIPDSDFLISMIKNDDVNHNQCVTITGKLNSRGLIFLVPVTAIVEAATALSRKYNQPQLAQALLETYADPLIKVIGISPEDYLGSINSFDSNGSKQNTPFDCLILSVAKDLKADVILSFDGWYKNRGFKTAHDLIEPNTTKTR